MTESAAESAKPGAALLAGGLLGKRVAALSQMSDLLNDPDPRAARLYQKLKRESPVKVNEPPAGKKPVIAQYVFNSDSRSAKKLGVNPGEVVIGPRSKHPHILAHELGHADLDRGAGRLLQNKTTAVAGRLGSNAIVGGALGYAAGRSGNETLEKWAPLAPLAASAPMLGYEALASVKGLKRMHAAGASAQQIRRAYRSMIPAWGTYVGGTAASSGAAMAGRALGQKHSEPSKTAMLDELRALGAVTDLQAEKLAEEISPEEALQSAKRLQKLEESAPSPSKMMRGALVGSIVQPLSSLAWRAAAGPKGRMGHPIYQGPRTMLAHASQGAIFGSLMPAGQHKLESEVEKQKLREFLGTHPKGTVRGTIRKTTGL